MLSFIAKTNLFDFLTTYYTNSNFIFSTKSPILKFNILLQLQTSKYPIYGLRKTLWFFILLRNLLKGVPGRKITLMNQLVWRSLERIMDNLCDYRINLGRSKSSSERSLRIQNAKYIKSDDRLFIYCKIYSKVIIIFTFCDIISCVEFTT